MKIIGIIFGLFLAISSALCDGTNKIDGAFGIKLGEIFDTTKGSLMDGISARYRVTPLIPHRYFETYFVTITPKTHKICAITAVSPQHLSDRDDVIAVQCDFLWKTLFEKYGSSKRDIYKNMIENGNRIIRLDPKESVGVFSLAYSDSNLMALAGRERDELASEKRSKAMELEKSKTDNSGL